MDNPPIEDILQAETDIQGELIIIRFPLTEDMLPLAKTAIRGMLLSFTRHQDRLDVIKDICHLCGGVNNICEHQGEKGAGSK